MQSELLDVCSTSSYVVQMSHMRSAAHTLQQELAEQLQRCTATGMRVPEVQGLWDVLVRAPDGSTFALVRSSAQSGGSGDRGAGGGNDSRSGDKENVEMVQRLSQKLQQLASAIERPASAPGSPAVRADVCVAADMLTRGIDCLVLDNAARREGAVPEPLYGIRNC